MSIPHRFGTTEEKAIIEAHIKKVSIPHRFGTTLNDFLDEFKRAVGTMSVNSS